MPIRDWTRVEAGIFHAFHHGWIEELSRALNRGILPEDYYALPEQHAAGLGPDVLTLQGPREEDDDNPRARWTEATALLSAAPKVAPTAETDLEFYRRKQKAVVVRHVSGDQVVAMIEIVSPGNKSGRRAMRSFIEKAAELLDKGIHLLIVDLLPPGPRDPEGIHGAIWEEITGERPLSSVSEPLTLVAYETALSVKAYVVHVHVGGTLNEMPLFLEPGACVQVPLETTCNAAFAGMPRRWQRVLEA